MVVFDPPHIIRKIPEKGILPMQYGVLHPDTWREDLKKGFDECWRVLMAEGVLVFKWNEQQKKLSELMDLFPAQPLFGHPTGSKSQTLWVCFMKFAEGKEPCDCIACIGSANPVHNSLNATHEKEETT